MDGGSPFLGRRATTTRTIRYNRIHFWKYDTINKKRWQFKISYIQGRQKRFAFHKTAKIMWNWVDWFEGSRDYLEDFSYSLLTHYMLTWRIKLNDAFYYKWGLTLNRNFGIIILYYASSFYPRVKSWRFVTSRICHIWI